MVAAIRQTVTIGPGGKIEVQSPELLEGRRADVTVVMEESPSIARKLAALDRLEKSLNLDEAKAEAWKREVREERRSWGPGE